MFLNTFRKNGQSICIRRVELRRRVRGHDFGATNHRPEIRRGQNPPTGQNETFRALRTERRRLEFWRIREV